MMSKNLKNKFEELCDDELEVIEEICSALELWVSNNKGKVTLKIIDLNGTFYNGGIYVAHNMFENEVMVEYSSDFIKSLIDVLDFYGDTPYHEDCVEEFWLPVLEAIV